MRPPMSRPNRNFFMFCHAGLEVGFDDRAVGEFVEYDVVGRGEREDNHRRGRLGAHIIRAIDRAEVTVDPAGVDAADLNILGRGFFD